MRLDNLEIMTISLGDLPADGNIGTASATVDIASSFNINQTTANRIFTLPAPTNPVDGLLVILNNTGTTPFTCYGSLVAVNQSVILTWAGGAWKSGSGNTPGGNIIAVANNYAPNQNLNFDNFKITINNVSGADLKLATLTGTASVKASTEQEYPGGSFTEGSNKSFVAFPLTTAYTTIGDGALVNGERFTTVLRDETGGQMYRITCWLHNTVGGNWSGWVERIGLSTNQIISAGAGINLNNGIISKASDTFALLTKTAVQATATNGTVNWDSAIVNQGGEVSFAGANITITPAATGVAKTYNILFNAATTFNALLAHSCDFRLRSPTAQTINGVAVPANGFFGNGAKLFSSTFVGQESGTGIIQYVITTSVPITFQVVVASQTNTPTLGNATNNSYPTISIQRV